MNHDIFLLLGTNQGEKKQNLLRAVNAIETHVGPIMKCSGVYETAAWGKQDQDDFYNQAIQVATEHSPQRLLNEILKIEAALGRLRTEVWGPRLIDIDILLFADLIVQENDLIIPHPRLHERRFALEPLNEIAGDVVHPQLRVSINNLLNTCTDPLPVKRVMP